MRKITKEQLISFEKEVYDLFEAGKLPYLVHLCGGNEDQLIEIFDSINDDDWVFSTHRTHYHFLLKGGTRDSLLEKIKNGDSMFVFDKNLKFFSSSILSGNACIAAGVALALKRKNINSKVWCFIGDGAEDEGHLYEAVRFCRGHNLNCVFIIEDNNRSVDTDKSTRRGADDNWVWPDNVMRYEYTPTFPHASTGSGKMVKFDPEIVSKYLNDIK